VSLDLFYKMDASTQTEGNTITAHDLSRSSRGVQVDDHELGDTWPEDSDSDEYWEAAYPVVCNSITFDPTFEYVLRCLACYCNPKTYDPAASHQSASCQTDYSEHLNDYYVDKIARFERDEDRVLALFVRPRPVLADTTNRRE